MGNCKVNPRLTFAKKTQNKIFKNKQTTKKTTRMIPIDFEKIFWGLKREKINILLGGVHPVTSDLQPVCHLKKENFIPTVK